MDAGREGRGETLSETFGNDELLRDLGERRVELKGLSGSRRMSGGISRSSEGRGEGRKGGGGRRPSSP